MAVTTCTAFGFLVAAVVIEVIAFGIPYWVDYGVNDTHTYFGLWNHCVSTTTCSSTASTAGLDTAWLRVVKAFATMALMLLGAGLGAAIVCMVCTESSIATIVACAVLFTQVLFVLIALAVFGANVDSVSNTVNYAKKLHAAFWLTLFGAILALTAACILAYAMCKQVQRVSEEVVEVEKA